MSDDKRRIYMAIYRQDRKLTGLSVFDHGRKHGQGELRVWLLAHRAAWCGWPARVLYDSDVDRPRLQALIQQLPVGAARAWFGEAQPEPIFGAIGSAIATIRQQDRRRYTRRVAVAMDDAGFAPFGQSCAY